MVDSFRARSAPRHSTVFADQGLEPYPCHVTELAKVRENRAAKAPRLCILHPEWRVCLHIAEVGFPAAAVSFHPSPVEAG
jgi:hypothetical protein